VLNWFIGPSISFDKSALNAVAETAAAVDVVQRQIYLMAQELAVLSDKLESLEERNSQSHSSP
jgi:cellobiose-specific phosphotransferase system component IIB